VERAAARQPTAWRIPVRVCFMDQNARMSNHPTRKVYQNGIEIGEILNTGNLDPDIQSAKVWLEKRGLLKEAPKAQRIYGAAGAFLDTSVQLHQQIQERHTGPAWDGRQAIPFVVNAAYAIELFLKAIGEATGKLSRGHDLQKFYRDLNPAGKQEIDPPSFVMAPRYSRNGQRPFSELLRTSARALSSGGIGGRSQRGAAR
jgi:hypothetical protein